MREADVLVPPGPYSLARGDRGRPQVPGSVPWTAEENAGKRTVLKVLSAKSAQDSLELRRIQKLRQRAVGQEADFGSTSLPQVREVSAEGYPGLVMTFAPELRCLFDEQTSSILNANQRVSEIRGRPGPRTDRPGPGLPIRRLS